MEVIVGVNSKREKKKKRIIQSDAYGDEFETEEEMEDEDDEMYEEDLDYDEINENNENDLYQ
jgi:hypothetical protein